MPTQTYLSNKPRQPFRLAVLIWGFVFSFSPQTDAIAKSVHVASSNSSAYSTADSSLAWAMPTLPNPTYPPYGRAPRDHAAQCVGSLVSSASLNYSKQTFDHHYLSAVGQSGIAAGENGFDIKVNQATDLWGAAITSLAPATQNKLQTARLTSRDLQNQQSTHSSSVNVGLSYSSQASGLGNLFQNASSNLLGNLAAGAGLPSNGHQASTTQSVISPALITLTGTGNAQTDQTSQATASLLTSREAKTANQSLSNSLTLQQAQDLQKQQQKQADNLRAAQIAGQALAGMIGDLAQAQQKQAQAAENAQAKAEGRDPKTITAWGEGSIEKTLLHTLSGAITAKLANTSIAAGATAGLLHEQLTPVLTQVTREILGPAPSAPTREQLQTLSPAEQSEGE